ncbi:MAG TPA: hypothetical protein VID68_10365 [Solirubrobacteraceae bacterium]|jgi:hypothetical protein
MRSNTCTAAPGTASRRAVRRSIRCAASPTLMLGGTPRAPHGRLRRVNSAAIQTPATTRVGYRAASSCC